MVRDTHQKTGAVFSADKQDLRRKDEIALEKMKLLEKQKVKKLRTFRVGNAVVTTTRTQEDWESYNPFILIISDDKTT